MKKKRFKLTTDGMALMTVLLLSTLLVLMTVSMVFISTNQLSLIGNIEGKAKALKAAESGIEYAIQKLNSNPAWGLKGDPVFPGGRMVDLSDANTFPKFVYEDNLTVTEPYTGDCKFTITFVPGSSSRSVNNLFNPVTGDANAPAYTAKIISSGTCGSITKSIEACLIRSDTSPNSINIAGRVSFTGDDTSDPLNYTGKVSILGRNGSEAGSIYSDYYNSDPQKFSIRAGNNAQIISNKGVFISRGTIAVPPNFDGSKVQYTAKDCLSKPINVDYIIGDAKNNLPNEDGGIITLKKDIDPNYWSQGIFYFGIVPNNSSGLSVGKTVNSDISYGQYGAYGETIILQLNRDLYIRSGGLRIIGESTATVQDIYCGSQTVGPLGEIINSSDKNATVQRSFFLNLNGHSIYSEDPDFPVTIALNLIGSGRIFSKGDIKYLIGVNAQETVTASDRNIDLEITKASGRCYTTGLYYAGGNMDIQPLKPGGDLDWGWGNNNITVKQVSGPVLKHDGGNWYNSFVTTLAQPDNGIITSVGEYHSDNNLYNGNGMTIAQVINKNTVDSFYVAVGSAQYINNTCVPGPLQLSFNQGGNITNVNLGGNIIKVTPPGVVYFDPNIPPDPNTINRDPNIVPTPSDPNITPVPIQTATPTPQPNTTYTVEVLGPDGGSPVPPVTITQDELNAFGPQLINYFNSISDSVDINIDGSIKQKGSSNLLFFDPGTKGNIVVSYDPSYMNSLVNIQKKFFTVKKSSSHEL